MGRVNLNLKNKFDLERLKDKVVARQNVLKFQVCISKTTRQILITFFCRYLWTCTIRLGNKIASGHARFYVRDLENPKNVHLFIMAPGL